jgi:hypothetical protein
MVYSDLFHNFFCFSSPGIHERTEEDDPYGFLGLRMEKSVHIVGCCFNHAGRYTAQPQSMNHPSDIQIFDDPNILLRSTYTNGLEWSAQGGSITNVAIEYQNDDPNRYFFGLKIGNQKSQEPSQLQMYNVGVKSDQQMAISCQSNASLEAYGCRLYHSQGSGVSLLNHSKGKK